MLMPVDMVDDGGRHHEATTIARRAEWVLG
jgi:hypothetical protein